MLRTLLLCLCQFPSSWFLHLSYFTSKFETLKHSKRVRKWCDEWQFTVMNEAINSKIGYKWFPSKTNIWRKDTKDKKATLGISTKKIYWFCSIVVGLLWRALLVKALVKTSFLKKTPHHIKVGFIEEDCMHTWTFFSNQTISQIKRNR